MMIENFKNRSEEFKVYDWKLLLKIINKTLLQTKKKIIKNFSYMKIGKLIQNI